MQYLGFRYHGWQRQPDVKTVQEMIEKTLTFVLKHDDFKILGASRTDAMVSATSAAFELFISQELELKTFLEDFNTNLPPDMRAIHAEKVNQEFNIIQDSTCKEYLYMFAFGEKSHPFCASMLTTYLDELSIPEMKQAATLLTGTHDFRNFCYQPKDTTETIRTLLHAEIVKNDKYSANFFPAESFIFRVKGAGFLRHQVRLMMGALVEVGRGRLDLTEFTQLLDPSHIPSDQYLAPASGLLLNDIQFNRLE